VSCFTLKMMAAGAFEIQLRLYLAMDAVASKKTVLVTTLTESNVSQELRGWFTRQTKRVFQTTYT